MPVSKMTKCVIKLEPSKHVQGRVLVWAEGESQPVRVTENEVLSFALYSGRKLDANEWTDLINASAVSSARALGARILGIRSLSRQELVKRLRDKGVADSNAEDAADWLEQIGVLDELEYAKSVVRYYSGRDYGTKKLHQELKRRAIREAYWDAALAEQCEAENNIIHFLQIKLHGRVPEKRELKRITDTLARRGFRWDEIKAGLSQYGMNLEEDSI